MALYRMADLNIDIQNEHDYTTRLCRAYRVHEEGKADLTAHADPSEYEIDRKTLPAATEGYLEALSIYRSIAHQLLEYDGFILHASVIERDGRAYAFCAKSGTGKTTHCRLWLDSFPDARIINGDKPLLRFVDGGLYIYGTPWCGKEFYHVNTRAPLAGLCFIERAPDNSIVRLSKTEAVTRLFPQLLMPKQEQAVTRLLELAGRMIDTIPAFVLKCNMEKEAALVSYEALSKNAVSNH